MPTLELTDKEFETLMKGWKHYLDNVNFKIIGNNIRPRKQPEYDDALALMDKLKEVGQNK